MCRAHDCLEGQSLPIERYVFCGFGLVGCQVAIRGNIRFRYLYGQRTATILVGDAAEGRGSESSSRERIVDIPILSEGIQRVVWILLTESVAVTQGKDL